MFSLHKQSKHKAPKPQFLCTFSNTGMSQVGPLQKTTLHCASVATATALTPQPQLPRPSRNTVRLSTGFSSQKPSLLAPCPFQLSIFLSIRPTSTTHAFAPRILNKPLIILSFQMQPLSSLVGVGGRSCKSVVTTKLECIPVQRKNQIHTLYIVEDYHHPRGSTMRGLQLYLSQLFYISESNQALPMPKAEQGCLPPF